jgi:PAS domain S-box-containing protein
MYRTEGLRSDQDLSHDILKNGHLLNPLVQGDDLFRELADAIPQLVWIADPEGEILWYNKRWYEYTGTTLDDMKESGWKPIHDPAFLPQIIERWQLSLTTGEPFEMKFPLRRADGVFRLFLTRVVPVRDSDGKVSRWFGTNTDIDAEEKILRELQESGDRLQVALSASQRLSAIVASSDDAIVSKGLDGIVTSWNAGAERMFGYTAEMMIGRSILTIIPPELSDDETRFLKVIAEGGRIEHFETYRRTLSGEMIEVSLTLSPVHDENGKVVGAAKIARDITQRKLAERALHISDRLASVGKLAATIAHEINNPLAAVTNLVFLAKLKTAESATRDLLDRAEEELARVSQLTKQTLGFFRGTTGAVSQSLSELVLPLVGLYSSRAGNKDVKIGTQILQDPAVYCIPSEIRQVVANLLNNSIDAVGLGGSVTIRISAATERSGTGRLGARLTIADSGCGIPAAIQKHLFEPFFTTKKDIGTGLGLWISKTIVEKHGGNIKMKSSTAPGKSWTAFSLFLPLNSATNIVVSEASAKPVAN